MRKMAYWNDSLVNIGIHFGPTSCDYAFATTYSLSNKPTKFQTGHWEGSRLLSLKAPTAVLFDKNVKVVSFGYEAENHFSEILVDSKEDSYYYFNNFQNFFSDQNLTESTELQDWSGEKVKAIHVCSSIIEYLTNLVRRRVAVNPMVYREQDLCYVLTVPATWTESNINFMRRAAEQAGKNRERLLIVPEPVAALAYWLHFADIRKLNVHNDFNPFNKTKKLVVDIGEDTTTITVLETRSNFLVQVASGAISWGGKSVNKAFSNMLYCIFGKSVIEEFRRDEMEDYLDLVREFEAKKHAIKSEQRVGFTLPVSLIELIKMKHKNVDSAIEKSDYKNKAWFSKQKLRIHPDCFYLLFHETNDKIVSFIRETLSHPELNGVETILMVGDYSECELMQTTCRKAFGKTIQLVIPEEAGQVVVKGAVVYAHNRLSIVKNENQVLLSFSDESAMIKAQSSVEKCVLCEKKGRLYCFECKAVYCHQCKITHDKIPSSKTHSISDLKIVDLTKATSKVSCSLHKHEYTFACSDCTVLICSTCVTTKHKGHTISDIKSFVATARNNAEKQVLRMKKDVKNLEDDVLKVKSMNTKAMITKAINEVKLVKDKMDETMQRHITLKYNEIEDVQKLQQEEIEYELSKKQRILSQQKGVLHSLERLLTENFDVIFFTTYTVLQNEICDVNNVMGSPITSEVKKLNTTTFLQDTINDIVSTFGLSVVAAIDGKAVLQKAAIPKLTKKITR